MSKKKRQRQSPKPQTISEKSLSDKSFALVAVLTICLLGAIIYSNSLDGPFVFDDITNIKENASGHVTELNQLFQAARGGRAPRPVAFFTFGLNHYWGGLDVSVYHLTNLAIHIAAGILVFFVALLTYRLSLGGNCGELDHSSNISVRWLSLFAACFFVAHPLQTQAVTYIVQRMTSLATMFYLLSLLLYILGRLKTPGWQRWSYWAGCIFAGLLAMGSKQIAATLPAVILLYEWFFFQNLNKAWATKQLKVLFVLFIFMVGISLLFLGKNPWHRITYPYTLRDFTMGERVLTQFRVVVEYLSLVILPLPSRLNLLHNIPTSQSLFNPLTTLFSLLTILLLVGSAIYSARKYRILSFGILWFFLNLVMESSVIALEMIYEHRVYLPMFGIALIVPLLLNQLPAKRSSFLTPAIAASIILLLGFGTYVRNQAWQSDISLWTDVVDKDTSFPRGYLERAHAYRLADQLEKAIPDYSKSIELDPDDLQKYNYRGVAYSKLGRFKLALDDFNHAMSLNPDDHEAYVNRGHLYRQTNQHQLAINDYSKAIELKQNDVISYNNRGAVYQSIGQNHLAIEDYSKTIEIQPNYAPAYNNRGNAYSALGDYHKAITDYNLTIQHAPGYAPAYVNRGLAYKKLGKFQLAIDDCQRAIDLIPNLMPAYECLAWLLSSSPNEDLRNGKLAIQTATRACQLSKWNNADSLEALAAAYAESGDFAAATNWQTKALQKSPPNSIIPRQERLELYKTQQPYRLVPQPNSELPTEK